MKFFSSLLFILILFSSCRSYRHIYSPAPANNPFFKSKGDAQIGAFYSGGDGNVGNGTRDKNEGFDIQGGYAISDNFMITGSYFSRRERDFYGDDYFDTSTVNYRRHLTELGAGFILPLDRRKIATVNVLGGLGFGKFQFTDAGMEGGLPYKRFHDASVTKWYLQSSLNIIGNGNFSIGFITRFCFVHYGKIKTDYSAGEQEYFNLDRLSSRSAAVFEPSMNMQFRIPNASWLKAEGCIGLAANWRSVLPSTRTVNASIGLLFDPGALKNAVK